MARHHAVTKESPVCIYLKNKAVTVDLVAVRLLAARLLVMKTGNHN
jgi:ABC-type phosphonate transport system ATPase subunit